MRTAAVTGANGHIGNVLCRELVSRGVATRALVHRRRDALEDAGVDIHPAELSDEASLRKAFEGVDTVFHLAAKISLNPRRSREIRKVNLDGTRRVIDACRQSGVRTLVYFSSIHVIDPFPQDEWLDETRNYTAIPKLAYEQSKLDAEREILSLSGLRTIVIIPTSVIGPYDFGPSLMGQVIHKMYRGALPAILPYGFNWVDVRDVAARSVEAALHGASGSRYILSGHYSDLSGLDAIIRPHRGRRGFSPLNCPPWIAHLFIPAYAGIMYALGREPLYNLASLDILRTAPRLVSHGKAQAELGYNPRSLKTTLEDTLHWIEQRENKIK